MEAWQTIVLALGGNVMLLAVLGWLSKSLVEKMLAKDLERFRASVSSEANSAIERLKHHLQLASLEHNVRFSKLHEKRAEVIAQLYGLLVEASWSASSFVSPVESGEGPSRQEKFVASINAFAEFFRFFDKNRIYLPSTLCKQLESLSGEMREKVVGLGVYIRYEHANLPQAAWEKKMEAWNTSWKYFQQELPVARESLEAELRSILGDASAVERKQVIQADAPSRRGSA